MHDSAVTGMLIFDDIIITSSKDATIKIWKYASTNTDRSLKDIQQVRFHFLSILFMFDTSQKSIQVHSNRFSGLTTTEVF